jgi:hypothetical protein
MIRRLLTGRRVCVGVVVVVGAVVVFFTSGMSALERDRVFVLVMLAVSSVPD